MKKSSNRLTRIEFIIEIIQWSVLVMIWYRVTLFKSINGVSYTVSKFVLWGLVLSLVAIGTVVSWKRWRNGISAAFTIMLPFSIFTIITYWKKIKILFVFAIVLALVLCLYFVVFLLRRPYQNQQMLSKKRRLQNIFVGMRNIISACLVIPVLILGISMIFINGIASTKTKATYPGENNKLANNIEVVAKLDNSTWMTLTTEEKVEVLQTVANIEAHYLGLPHELNVRLGLLPEPDLAVYNDDTHIVMISMEHVENDSPEDILDSVCHECFHAHQRRLCDAYESISDEYKNLLEFYNVQVYKDEFSNYIGDNSTDYYDQLVEKHARVYGAESVKDYYRHINEYLGREISEKENKTPKCMYQKLVIDQVI